MTPTDPKHKNTALQQVFLTIKILLLGGLVFGGLWLLDRAISN